MKKIIDVQIGHVAAASGKTVLKSSALGSCVAVAVWDNAGGVGAMAHIMLPSDPHKRKRGSVYKYADTAVPCLVDELIKKGAGRAKLTAKIAGGANMFKSIQVSKHTNIGLRNTEKVIEVLKEHGIRILASDTGETYGRKATFDPGTGRLTIEGFGREAKTI